jgi:hypothetical protein
MHSPVQSHAGDGVGVGGFSASTKTKSFIFLVFSLLMFQPKI